MKFIFNEILYVNIIWFEWSERWKIIEVDLQFRKILNECEIKNKKMIDLFDFESLHLPINLM